MGKKLYDKDWFVHREEIYKFQPPTLKLRRELILKLIPSDGRGKIALDVGCGPGAYTREFLKRGFNVEAIDISEYVVKELKKKLRPKFPGRLETKVVKIEDFYTDKKYDFILLSEVLEHISNDRKVVEKVASYLKDNGKLLISVPYDQRLYSRSDINSGHLRRYSRNQLKDLLNSEQGLKIEKLWCYGFPFLRLFQLYRKTSVVKYTSKSPRGLKREIMKLISFLAGKCLILDRIFLNTSQGVGLIVVVRKET